MCFGSYSARIVYLIVLDKIVNFKMAFLVGAIVWARFDGFTFWPAILQQLSEQEFTVKFLADKGRMAKVGPARVIPFKGVKQYWEWANNRRTEERVGFNNIKYIHYIKIF